MTPSPQKIESPNTPGAARRLQSPRHAGLLKLFERPDPADAENPVASCNLHVLVDETAEPISS
jgi:hypothetical protein